MKAWGQDLSERRVEKYRCPRRRIKYFAEELTLLMTSKRAEYGLTREDAITALSMILGEANIEDRHFKTIVAELEALKKLYRIACVDMAKEKARADQYTRWFDGITAFSKSNRALPALPLR